MRANILDVIVSKVMNYSDTRIQKVNLMDYLKDNTLKDKVEKIRSIDDEDKQKSFESIISGYNCFWTIQETKRIRIN